jgi:HNH endonuclease
LDRKDCLLDITCYDATKVMEVYMDIEEWRDVPSVPQVQASSWGRVRLKPYSCVMYNGGIRHYIPKPRTGRPMSKSTGREGAPKRLMIYYTGLNKAFLVSRLICEAFHGTAPKDKPICMHLDENPSNNTPGNLAWGTQRENLSMPKVQEAFRARVGEKSPRAIHLARKGKIQ